MSVNYLREVVVFEYVENVGENIRIEWRTEQTWKQRWFDLQKKVDKRLQEFIWQECHKLHAKKT